VGGVTGLDMGAGLAGVLALVGGLPSSPHLLMVFWGVKDVNKSYWGSLK